MSETLYDLVREIPDFPKPGILFRDITPILLDHRALAEAVRRVAEPVRGAGITKVVAIESRGFVLAGPVALELGAGVVLVRKEGKLPRETHRVTYDLEYGRDALEMHVDALSPSDRAVIVDDVLATGGTAVATAELVERSGATVIGLSFLIELADLGGRRRLGDRAIHVVLTYPRST